MDVRGGAAFGRQADFAVIDGAAKRRPLRQHVARGRSSEAYSAELGAGRRNTLSPSRFELPPSLCELWRTSRRTRRYFALRAERAFVALVARMSQNAGANPDVASAFARGYGGQVAHPGYATLIRAALAHGDDGSAALINAWAASPAVSM